MMFHASKRMKIIFGALTIEKLHTVGTPVNATTLSSTGNAEKFHENECFYFFS